MEIEKVGSSTWTIDALLYCHLHHSHHSHARIVDTHPTFEEFLNHGTRNTYRPSHRWCTPLIMISKTQTGCGRHIVTEIATQWSSSTALPTKFIILLKNQSFHNCLMHGKRLYSLMIFHHYHFRAWRKFFEWSTMVGAFLQLPILILHTRWLLSEHIIWRLC